MARVALSSLYPPSRFFLTDRIRRASGTPLTSPLPRRSQPRARGARPARRSVVATAEKSAKKDEKAKLPKEYKHHSPGSVQETDDVVVFAHQGEDADKWEATAVHHVGDESDAPVRLGVVIGEFHNKLMDLMLEDARVAAADMVRPDPTPMSFREPNRLFAPLEEPLPSRPIPSRFTSPQGATIDEVIWVPGTYEAPLVVEKMLESEAIDAVVVVGYIEKGSTLHGQEMGATCSLVFKQLELEYSKPVGMGIIGPGATAEQAEGRVAYAGNATRASIRMARFMAAVKPE